MIDKIIGLIQSFWDSYKANPYILISFALIGSIISMGVIMAEMSNELTECQVAQVEMLKTFNEKNAKRDSIEKANIPPVNKKKRQK